MVKKTKRRRSRKQSRRSRKKSSRRKRQAGNILIRDFFDEKTPVAQNNYLRRALSNEIGDIQYQLESRYFTTHWKPIDRFLKKLSRYKLISYQGNLDPPPLTFIDELYKNRIELLQNIKEIELMPNLYYKYKALSSHPGAHHYSKTIKKKFNQMLIEDSKNERKLPDIIKNMEKNVLPLTELIKTVIEMEIIKRKRP